MTGRPINEDRLNAIELGLMTYTGAVHARCGTDQRYVNGGGCVHCGRAIATEQREARRYLRAQQASASSAHDAEVLDNEPEPAVKPEKTFDESVDDLM